MINLKSFVTDHIYYGKDSSVFIKLLEYIFNDIKELIDAYPELASIDDAPEIFLPKLSQLIKYEYNYEIDTDIQREVIKRLIETYRRRGTNDSIIMAASYGDNEKWIADHLFLPEADKELTKAILVNPLNHLFRHDISKFSGIHRYSDKGSWRSGVLLIRVKVLNEDIRKAIAKVVPAGVKIYFETYNEFLGTGEGNSVVMGEWTISEEFLIDYNSRIKDTLHVAYFSVPSKATTRRVRSGNQVIFSEYLIDKYTASDMAVTELHKLVEVGFLDLKLSDYVLVKDTKSSGLVLKQVCDLDNKFDLIKVQYNNRNYYVRPSSLFNSQMLFVVYKLYDGNLTTSYNSEDLSYNISGFEGKKYHYGRSIRSHSSSRRSCKYALSGSRVNEIILQADIREVRPYDTYYPVSAILSLKPYQLLHNYCNNFEVTIEKLSE